MRTELWPRQSQIPGLPVRRKRLLLSKRIPLGMCVNIRLRLDRRRYRLLGDWLPLAISHGSFLDLDPFERRQILSTRLPVLAHRLTTTRALATRAAVTIVGMLAVRLPRLGAEHCYKMVGP